MLSSYKRSRGRGEEAVGDASNREEDKWASKVKGSKSVPVWRYLLFLCICTWSLAMEGNETKSTLSSAPRLNCDRHAVFF